MQHVMIPHNVATNQAEGQTGCIMSPHRIGWSQQMSILIDFIASFLNLLKWDREFIIARIECQEKNLKFQILQCFRSFPQLNCHANSNKIIPVEKS